MTYLPVNKLAKWRKENEPSQCPILETKTNDWVVDHDHKSGEIRGVISRQANTLIGKMENIYTTMCKGDPAELPGVLENIAAYLLDHVISELPANHTITHVKVRVYETEKTYAEVERNT